MTTTQTKTVTNTTLAAKIQVDNILQLSLVQSTLEANFKAILQALSQNDADINQLKQKGNHTAGQLVMMSSGQDLMKKQIASLKQNLQKLQQQKSAHKIQDIKSPNPQSSQSSVLAIRVQALQKQNQQLQQKTTKSENSIMQNASDTKNQLDKLRNQLQKLTGGNGSGGSIGNLQKNIRQLQKMAKQLQNSDKQNINKINLLDSQISKLKKTDNTQLADINQMMKQIEKLKQKLGQFTESQYKTDSQKIQSRLSQLQKNYNQLKNNLEQEKRLRVKLGQQLWKLHDNMSKISETNLTNQIISDTIKYLKKQVSDLQKKINQFSNVDNGRGFSAGYSTGYKVFFNDTTRQSPSKHKITQTQSPEKGEVKYEDLRQEMLDKFKQLRSDFLKTLKKMGVKSQEQAGNQQKKFDSIEEALLRLQHILGDKASLDSVKKLISNLQSKMSYIYNIFFGQGNSEEDACIARKNWVCLSCDKKLDKYQGKIGHHLVNSQLKAKGLDQDTVGGGMLLKPSKSKVDLPNVFSKSAKRQ